MQATVLLVDDDHDVLESTTQLLMAKGLRVITSTSPFGVSNLVRQHAPDVVVLDVRMPALDGRTLATLLAKQPGTVTPIVIFYSGIDEPELQKLTRQLAGARYVLKSRGAVALYQEITRSLPKGGG